MPGEIRREFSPQGSNSAAGSATGKGVTSMSAADKRVNTLTAKLLAYLCSGGTSRLAGMGRTVLTRTTP